MNLQEWKEAANRETRGDMVWDILHDWENSQPKKKGRPRPSAKPHSLQQCCSPPVAITLHALTWLKIAEFMESALKNPLTDDFDRLEIPVWCEKIKRECAKAENRPR